MALVFLQLLMNHLQYPISLMNLFMLDNFCVMASPGCIHAMCTFLIASLTLGVIISVVGQLDGFCESHCCPFQHSVDVDRIVGSIPLEIRSAGLDRDGTSLHESDAVSS